MYHSVLFGNDVTVNWSMVTTFGPLSVIQTTLFSILVSSAKGECVEHGAKGHEIRDGNNVWLWGEVGAPMGHMKLLLSKGESSLRGEVGWVRAVLGSVWRLEVLGSS